MQWQHEVPRCSSVRIIRSGLTKWDNWWQLIADSGPSDHLRPAGPSLVPYITLCQLQDREVDFSFFVGKFYPFLTRILENYGPVPIVAAPPLLRSWAGPTSAVCADTRPGRTVNTGPAPGKETPDLLHIFQQIESVLSVMD